MARLTLTQYTAISLQTCLFLEGLEGVLAAVVVVVKKKKSIYTFSFYTCCTVTGLVNLFHFYQQSCLKLKEYLLSNYVK